MYGLIQPFLKRPIVLLDVDVTRPSRSRLPGPGVGAPDLVQLQHPEVSRDLRRRRRRLPGKSFHDSANYLMSPLVLLEGLDWLLFHLRDVRQVFGQISDQKLCFLVTFALKSLHKKIILCPFLRDQVVHV